MSLQKFRECLISKIPFRRLRKKLAYRYGWFPGNYVQPDVKISSIRKLELGGNVYVAGNGTKLCCEGGVKIGCNTQVAEGCFFLSTNHNYKTEDGSETIPSAVFFGTRDEDDWIIGEEAKQAILLDIIINNIIGQILKSCDMIIL